MLNNDSLYLIEKLRDNFGWWNCEFCDKNFKKQSNLRKHLNPQHKNYCKWAYKFKVRKLGEFCSSISTSY